MAEPLQTSEATPHEVIKQQTVQQDFTVLRIAVVGVVVAVVLSLVAVAVLTGFDKQVPEGVIAIGSASVGALATMLVRNVGNGA